MSSDYVQQFIEDMNYFQYKEESNEWMMYDVSTLVKALVPGLNGLIDKIRAMCNCYKIDLIDEIKQLGKKCSRTDCVVHSIPGAEQDDTGRVRVQLSISHPKWVYQFVPDESTRSDFISYYSRLCTYLKESNSNQCILCDYFSYTTSSDSPQNYMNLLGVRDFDVSNRFYLHNSQHILSNDRNGCCISEFGSI